MQWLLTVMFWIEKALAAVRLAKSPRAIFRYWDGTEWRRCDPLAALMAIDADPEFRVDQHPQGVDAGDAECTLILCRMVDRTFSVRGYDPGSGKGLTIAEHIALYTQFCRYCEELKKSTDLTQISPSPTVPTSTESTEETMKPTQDSTSASTEQS